MLNIEVQNIKKGRYGKKGREGKLKKNKVKREIMKENNIENCSENYD